MRFKNVLLLYKRSAYKIYFLDNKNALRTKNQKLFLHERQRLQEAHDDHYKALHRVVKILLTHGIQFDEAYRGRNINYDKYDLIFTVGGDGTFLEAARNAKHQMILGVNSALRFSVGRYCAVNADNFEKFLKKILSNQYGIVQYPRLRIFLGGFKGKYDALNDVLICHRNPAMLSRYVIQLGHKSEEQRSSGIWVSTPAGSSAAIHSAGGNVLAPTDKKIQYLIRELYRREYYKYRLVGGVLNTKQDLSITSLMREGAVYIDGAHHHVPFPYGETIRLAVSPVPVKTFKF